MLTYERFQNASFGLEFTPQETATGAIPTTLVWSGYTPGDQLNVSSKGLANYSVIDPATGQVVQALDHIPLQIKAGDTTLTTIVAQQITGIAAPGTYQIILFIDTTASTTMTATQRFRDEFVYKLVVKPLAEHF